MKSLDPGDSLMAKPVYRRPNGLVINSKIHLGRYDRGSQTQISSNRIGEQVALANVFPEHLHVLMSGGGGDLALFHTALGSLCRKASTQAMAGIIAFKTCSPSELLDDEGHTLVRHTGFDVAVPVDSPENTTLGDARLLQVGFQVGDGTEVGLVRAIAMT